MEEHLDTQIEKLQEVLETKGDDAIHNVEMQLDQNIENLMFGIDSVIRTKSDVWYIVIPIS